MKKTVEIIPVRVTGGSVTRTTDADATGYAWRITDHQSVVRMCPVLRPAETLEDAWDVAHKTAAGLGYRVLGPALEG